MKASTLLGTVAVVGGGTWAWMKGKFPFQSKIQEGLASLPVVGSMASADASGGAAGGDDTLDNVLPPNGGGGGGGFSIHPKIKPAPKTVLAGSGTVIAKTGFANAMVDAINARGCKDPSAMAAVKKFQSYLGLTADGKYGPITAATAKKWAFGRAIPAPCKF